MDIAIALLLFMWLFIVLAWGLVSLVQNVLGKTAYGLPEFREPGPIFHHSTQQLGARSQFAWQSRSHSRAPD
jgi:hypothetical protein